MRLSLAGIPTGSSPPLAIPSDPLAWLSPRNVEEDGVDQVENNRAKRTESFRDFRREMSRLFPDLVGAPDIVALLSQCLDYVNPVRQELVAKVLRWVETEALLGTLDEEDMISLLSHSFTARTSEPVNSDDLWSISVPIWNGIKASRVRKISDLGDEATALLLRAIFRDNPGPLGAGYIKDMLSMLAEAGSTRAVPLVLLCLQDFMARDRIPGELSFDNLKYTGRYETFKDLLEGLPPQVCSGSILKVLLELVSELRLSRDRQTDKRQTWLRTWLSMLSKSGILADARRTLAAEPGWQLLEWSFSVLDIETLALYLRVLSDHEICVYIVEYLIPPWRHTDAVPQARPSNHTTKQLQMKRMALKALMRERPEDSDPFSWLATSVDAIFPGYADRISRLLFSLMYQLKRPNIVLKLTKRSHSDRLQKDTISLELLFSEVARWTEADPAFALRLLCTDKRPAAGLCPSIPRALELAQDCPAEVLLKLTDLLLRTYGRRRRSSSPLWTTTRYPITKYSAGLLHRLATRLSTQSEMRPGIGFRRLYRVLILFRDAPEQLKREMSIALTQSGIVNRLKAKHKVPDWQQQWIGKCVTILEGISMWRKVETSAERWWRQVEHEERHNRRVWRPGTGWVSHARGAHRAHDCN